jgi:hypothetical protein
MAQCPSHNDRQASLAIYRKPRRIKIVCFTGCHNELDILPALGLTLRDLWDEPKTVQKFGGTLRFTFGRGETSFQELISEPVVATVFVDRNSGRFINCILKNRSSAAV